MVGRKTENKMSGGHFDVYAAYSQSLRGWFVAYGVGFFVLVFGNDVAQKAFVEIPNKKLVAGLFLFGVVAQLILVFLNKYLMWSNYWSTSSAAYSNSFCAKICESISEKIWIDLVIDLSTLIAYFLATVLLLLIGLG